MGSAEHLAPARVVGRVLTAVVIVAAVVALLPVVATLAGYPSLFVRSGSMRPTLEVGDAIVTHPISPARVRVGDVITFTDPHFNNALVTHRVADVQRGGLLFAFVTRGDANTGVERWTMPASGTVGQLVLRVPHVGRVLGWTAAPVGRAMLAGLLMLLILETLLRRIWRTA